MKVELFRGPLDGLKITLDCTDPHVGHRLSVPRLNKTTGLLDRYIYEKDKDGRFIYKESYVAS